MDTRLDNSVIPFQAEWKPRDVRQKKELTTLYLLAMLATTSLSAATAPADDRAFRLAAASAPPGAVPLA